MMPPAAHAQLPPDVTLLHTDDLVALSFEVPRRVLSSAVLNGGFCIAEGLLNLRVSADGCAALEAPETTLQRTCDEMHCTGLRVGLMTAASMNSLRIVGTHIEQQSLHVVVTVGLENARRAGDPAEQRSLYVDLEQHGTINLVVLTSAQLSDAVMVEMVAVATEAKAAILQELKVTSPVSGLTATGTGTDAIAIVAGANDDDSRGQLGQEPGEGESIVQFAGKHTVFGERLAVLVMDAIRSSISYKAETGS